MYKNFWIKTLSVCAVVVIFGFAFHLQVNSQQVLDQSSRIDEEPMLLFNFTNTNSSKFWFEDVVAKDPQKINNKEVNFTEVTTAAGIPMVYGLSIAVGDYNNDNKPDLLAGGFLFRNVSTLNNIKFVNETASTELGTLRGYPSWVDLNNDGRLDIVSTSGQVLIQSNERKFIESAKALGLELPEKSYTVSFVDLNQDSWVDVLIGRNEHHSESGFSFEKPVAFINRNGKRFSPWTQLSFLTLPGAYTRGIIWADYNRDGKPDGYFSNYRLKANYLFTKSLLGWGDVAKRAGVAGDYNATKYYDAKNDQKYGPSYGHTIGSVWADFNNDGLFDLWASNLVHKFVGDSKSGYDIRGYLCDDSKIYKNMGPPTYNFQDMRDVSSIPLKPMGDWSKYKGDELWAHTTSGDFDNDGLIDVYVTQVYNLNYAYSLLFKNQGSFKFKLVSRGQNFESFDGYGGAWVDLNGDGLLDLVNSGRPKVDAPSQVRVFKNETYNGNNFLKVKLHPGASGKNPITTQVSVFHENGMLLRQVEGVTGSLNQQNDPVLHFGLGKINKINLVEIRWSSGRVTLVKKDIKLNATLHVTEP